VMQAVARGLDSDDKALETTSRDVAEEDEFPPTQEYPEDMSEFFPDDACNQGAAPASGRRRECSRPQNKKSCGSRNRVETPSHTSKPCSPVPGGHRGAGSAMKSSPVTRGTGFAQKLQQGVSPAAESQSEGECVLISVSGVKQCWPSMVRSAAPTPSSSSSSSAEPARWNCPDCDEPNRGDRMKCNNCGRAKPEAAAKPISRRSRQVRISEALHSTQRQSEENLEAAIAEFTAALVGVCSARSISKSEYTSQVHSTSELALKHTGMCEQVVGVIDSVMQAANADADLHVRGVIHSVDSILNKAFMVDDRRQSMPEAVSLANLMKPRLDEWMSKFMAESQESSKLHKVRTLIARWRKWGCLSAECTQRLLAKFREAQSRIRLTEESRGCESMEGLHASGGAPRDLKMGGRTRDHRR